MESLFSLAGIDPQYRSHKTAYHEYCSLLQYLSEQIYGPQKPPYWAEMLLFVVAPTKIIEAIKRSVKVTIDFNNGTASEQGNSAAF